MYIKDVHNLEDFTVYVLTHGYNFIINDVRSFDSHISTHLGFYWMWKAGSAKIHQIRRTTKFLEDRYGFRGYEVVFKTDIQANHSAEQRSSNPRLVLLKYPPNDKMLKEMLNEYNRS
jgi:hypothetical protein